MADILTDIRYPSSIKKTVAKNAHGFSKGNVLTYKAGEWVKVSADTDKPIGIVTTIFNTKKFDILLGGYTGKLSGLTANTLYYAQTDGSLGTTVTPNPIFYAIGTDQGFMLSPGLTSVLQLSDTFSSFTALYFLRINAAGDAIELIDPITVQTIKNVGTIAEGGSPVSVTLDSENFQQSKAFWSTSETAVTLNVTNFGQVANVSVKKTITGDTAVTLSGTGLKFVDLDNKTAPATTVDITLSNATANMYFEISLMDSGDTNGGSRVINVIAK